MSWRSEDDKALLLAFIAWLDSGLTDEQAVDWNTKPEMTVAEFLKQREERREKEATARPTVP